MEDGNFRLLQNNVDEHLKTGEFIETDHAKADATVGLAYATRAFQKWKADKGE